MTPGSGEAAINFIFSVSLTVFIYSNYFAAFIFLQASLRSSGLKHCCGYEKTTDCKNVRRGYTGSGIL
jgi:hypothetical protein